eukprot:7485869-Lingulodinium_polyedra.AAC.1
MSVIKFFAENRLHLSNVAGARIGMGLRELPPIKGFHGAVCILWRPGSTYTRISEHVAELDQSLGRIRLHQ